MTNSVDDAPIPATARPSTNRRQRAIRIATGRWHPWADPTPARAHVLRLRDQGASYQAIAEAAGLAVMTVHAIVNRRGRVTAGTAAAVLAVTDTDLHGARLDAGGTRLRLRALQVMGHTSARVARAIGVREQAIQKITRGDARTVSPQLRDAVARIYDAWWDKRAPERTRHERATATAARRRAIRGNWCPGAGLDEDELDTPGYRAAAGWRPARGTGVAEEIAPPRRDEEDPSRLLETRARGQPASGRRTGSRSGGEAVSTSVSTRWEQKIELARAKRLARARQLAAGRGTSRQPVVHLAAAVDAEPSRDIGRGGERRMGAEQGRAVERAQAARSVGCLCHAEGGVPCGPTGDHLARYLRAEQQGAITREALKEVIAGLDVIAPHLTIKPTGELAPRAPGAATTDQLLGARTDPGMGDNRIDASAESTLAARLDHPTATFSTSDHDRAEAARYACDEPELETGA
jgi:plasmid maintenance system antidote protein VapI